MTEKTNLPEDQRFGFDTYLSPFTWRYASPEMRRIFSLLHERVELPGRIWVAVAKVQADYGIIDTGQYEDIRKGIENADMYKVLLRSLELEKIYKHDLIATKDAFAEECSVGGAVLHHGMTSMDIQNNMEAMVLKEALIIIEERVVNLLRALQDKMIDFFDLICMGWTHIVAAEPITFSFRLAQFSQDLLLDLRSLRNLVILAKGFKGAVGTSASYQEMLKGKATTREFEGAVLSQLGLQAFDITNQTIPRKQDLEVLQLLARISQSVYRLARDIRLLNSSFCMEVSEPSRKGQKGSSAMPGKPPNPINTEGCCSLATLPFAFEQVAWLNASLSMLERTLDDSGNRRIFVPEAFLASDDILMRMEKVITGLITHKSMMEKHLEEFGPFAATESLLIAMVEKGFDRQEGHKVLNDICVSSWEAVKEGRSNPLIRLALENEVIAGVLSQEEIRRALASYREHTGDAKERTQTLLDEIHKEINT